MSSQINLIKNWLIKQDKTLTGKSIFRLVWSDIQLEKRFGTYNDFSDSGLFLRQVTEVRETLKYNYIKERWILEYFCSPETSFNPEIPESTQGTYEPLWVFEDKNRNYIEPSLKAVQFIIKFMREKASPSERKQFYDSVEDKEVKELEEQIGAESRSPIKSLLNTREAESMYFKEPKK